MVAVTAYAHGRDVTLTPFERLVAMHAMRHAGHSTHTIAARFGDNETRVAAKLARPAPVDSHGHAFTITTF
jgi:hypothetical protein